MDSTMLYSLVLEHLHKKQELLNLLPSLNAQLLPTSKLSTQKMTDQQIFAQIYKAVNNSLKQSQQEKESLIANLNQETVQQEEQQQQEEELQGQYMQGEQQQNQGEEEQRLEGQEQADFDGIEEQQNQDDLADEPVGEYEDDVGLYGQQIDEEDMESYQNEGDSQEDREFEEQFNGKRNKRHQEGYQEADDEGEDALNDQFDHFRQIQMQNKQEENTRTEQKNTLQKQIETLENDLIQKKGWVLKGEVKASQRPVNSLLQYDLQFKSGIRLDQEITPQFNSDLQKMIKQRILDELYDDRVRYQHSQVLREQYSSLKEVSTEKSKLGLSELYEAQFKNHLGLGQNKQDKLKTEIFQAFKQVNYYLDSLSNLHFTPRPTVGSKAQAVISEQKVPINMWSKNGELSTKQNTKFESEKEQDNKGKRLKNKRIARQRKKEQIKKKLNKKIEYGGLTKFQAKAIVKKNKNNLNPETNIKFNKSAKFFEEMNKDKSKKPNPNINKLKI